MTLAEISSTLPNGFHDSELRELAIDFVKQEARLLLDVWTGDLDSEDEAVRERYQPAELHLGGLEFWISGPPNPTGCVLDGGSLSIDIGLKGESHNPGVALPPSNPECPTYWLYSTDLNTCFYFACRSASLGWL